MLASTWGRAATHAKPQLYTIAAAAPAPPQRTNLTESTKPRTLRNETAKPRNHRNETTRNLVVSNMQKNSIRFKRFFETTNFLKPRGISWFQLCDFVVSWFRSVLSLHAFGLQCQKILREHRLYDKVPRQFVDRFTACMRLACSCAGFFGSSTLMLNPFVVANPPFP